MATDDVILEGVGLRVRFTWRIDRYAHELWADCGGSWVCLLASVEDDPAVRWPASPPLQSLHVEPRAGGNQVALLVGMAGKSHWSASVELVPAAAELRFEIACRAAEPRGALGSRYRVASPIAEASSHSVSFANAPPGRRGARLWLPRAESTQLHAAPRELTIGPVFPEEGPSARTVCWSYTVCSS